VKVIVHFTYSKIKTQIRYAGFTFLSFSGIIRYPLIQNAQLYINPRIFTILQSVEYEKS